MDFLYGASVWEVVKNIDAFVLYPHLGVSASDYPLLMLYSFELAMIPLQTFIVRRQM